VWRRRWLDRGGTGGNPRQTRGGTVLGTDCIEAGRAPRPWSTSNTKALSEHWSASLWDDGETM